MTLLSSIFFKYLFVRRIGLGYTVGFLRPIMCWWDVKPYSINQSSLSWHADCVKCCQLYALYVCCRTSSVPVMSNEHQWIPGLVYWPLELLHCSLPAGGRARWSAGNWPLDHTQATLQSGRGVDCTVRYSGGPSVLDCFQLTLHVNVGKSPVSRPTDAVLAERLQQYRCLSACELLSSWSKTWCCHLLLSLTAVQTTRRLLKNPS